MQSMCDQRYRGALLLFLAGGAHSAWVAGAVSGRSRHGVALAERGGSGGAGRGASLCMVQTVAPGATPGAGRAAAPSTDAEGPPLPLTAGERFALDEKTMSPAALARREEQLERSYELCREITAHYSKTFFMGTRLFPPDKARAVWAVYAWCRRTDDIVDKPRADRTSLRTELTEWQRRLTDVWEGKPYDLIDLALADTVRKFPALTITPFEDMIKGMVMDLDQNRFETFEELYVYCYRVAGTVGLMTMPIMGTADGYTEEDALEPALALGVALQLTNILRDVGEDRHRQRIYIPQEDLRRFGVSEQALIKGVRSDKYVALLKFQIERAREWYKRAEEGVNMLSQEARLPVRASLDMYSSILDKIEANQYDNFEKRAYTTKWEKLALLPGAWLKTRPK